jgi:hypothetical protein
MKKYLLFLLIPAMLLAACKPKENKTENNEPEDKPAQTVKKADYDSIRVVLTKAFRADQYYRFLLDSLEQIHGWDSPEIQETYALMHKVDSVNLKVVDEIIRNYGWPGPSKVGEMASNGAFLVLQHSGNVATMEKYLPLLKEAAAAGELEQQLLALYIDRIKMFKKEKQIYGSQIVFNEQKKVLELYPVQDIANVNQRRAEVGLEPLQEYLQMMKVPFDADTLGF